MYNLQVICVYKAKLFLNKKSIKDVGICLFKLLIIIAKKKILRRCEYIERKTPSKNILEFLKHFFLDHPVYIRFISRIVSNLFIDDLGDYESNFELLFIINSYNNWIIEKSHKIEKSIGLLQSFIADFIHSENG